MTEQALPGSRNRGSSPSVATSTNSHLEIDAVTKNFGSQAVLKGVNLSVAKGGTTAIVGPSGSARPRCCASGRRV